MSSSYALPSSALPHAHHGHMHSHAHSQSQSSLHSWKSSISSSNGRLHTYHEDGSDHHDHDHSHEHDSSRETSYGHNRAGSYASNSSAAVSRGKPSLSPLDLGAQWDEAKTPTGPRTPGFPETPTPHAAFENNHEHHHGHDHSHDHDSHHHHGHGHHHHEHHDHDAAAKRSLFTRTLLPYTAQFPILHAIMTEKDSRRIFYFMTFVLPSGSPIRRELKANWL